MDTMSGPDKEIQRAIVYKALVFNGIPKRETPDLPRYVAKHGVIHGAPLVLTSPRSPGNLDQLEDVKNASALIDQVGDTKLPGQGPRGRHGGVHEIPPCG